MKFLKRLAAVVLAALALIAAGFAGWFAYAREQSGQDGRWFVLLALLLIGLVVAHSGRRDGSAVSNPRTVLALSAGGVFGLALVAVEPDALEMVLLVIGAVWLITQRDRSVKT